MLATPYWRSPSGTTEDRNQVDGYLSGALLRVWRSPFRATEDRNILGGSTVIAASCWRSPSETTENRNITPDGLEEAPEDWRPPSRATKDRSRVSASVHVGPGPTGGRPPGRPRISTAMGGSRTTSPDSWRSPSMATEDRNTWRWSWMTVPVYWRSPSGAAEDHNADLIRRRRAELSPAVVLWGDRGSQPSGRLSVGCARPRGGCSPGRPRTATEWPGPRTPSAGHWRSPSGVIEDRNRLTA